MPEKNVTGAFASSLEHGAPQVSTLESEGRPESAIASEDIPAFGAREVGLAARGQRRWGSMYQPELDDEEGRQQFRRICDDIYEQVCQLEEHVDNAVVADEACGVVAEIQNLLEVLYKCPFGDGESLKSVVVVLQSQLNNAQWTDKHVGLVRAAIRLLRVRCVVNDQTASEVYEMIEEFGLDSLRGTVSESDVLARYRIERIEDS